MGIRKCKYVTLSEQTDENGRPRMLCYLIRKRNFMRTSKSNEIEDIRCRFRCIDEQPTCQIRREYEKDTDKFMAE